MKTIFLPDSKIEIGSISDSSFSQVLRSFSTAKKIILVDENTHEHCLPFLITTFEELSEAEILLVPAGEDCKDLEIVANLWAALSEYEISRSDLLINLGGGAVTDLGGFLASTYKRGMNFINVPTSLLAMVDASIGGKTGINFMGLKNQVGVFSSAKNVFIDTAFLSTLPKEELLSGYAEMIKHGLISSSELYRKVMDSMQSDFVVSIELLEECLLVKKSIVEIDPLEKGVRKTLNFGHTVGHAIESLMNSKGNITHGHAIALGMIYELQLSEKILGLNAKQSTKIQKEINALYSSVDFSQREAQQLVSLMKNDKKNHLGTIKMALLKEVGKCEFDVKVEEAEIRLKT